MVLWLQALLARIGGAISGSCNIGLPLKLVCTVFLGAVVTEVGFCSKMTPGPESGLKKLRQEEKNCGAASTYDINEKPVTFTQLYTCFKKATALL